MRNVTELNDDERRFLTGKLVEFNNRKVPFTQDPPFIELHFGVRDSSGDLVAGISGVMYCWRCLAIEVLWVDGRCRSAGHGTALLEHVERHARESGCTLAHLDTFDFQAKEFYERRGYEVFGTLEQCPPGHRRFYLKKDL